MEEADIIKQRFNTHDRSQMSYMSYESKKFYLQTTAKTASSWSNMRIDDTPVNLSFKINTLKAYTEAAEIGEGEESDYGKQQKKTIKDWNSLMNGKSCKKDFVFFIRNPLEKVATGFVQDVLLKEINEDSVNSLLFQKYLLDLGYSKYEVTNFCNFYNPNFHAQNKRGGVNSKNFQNFPDVSNFGTDNIFLPIFYHMIESIVDHWCTDIPRVINEVNQGHKMSNLLFILKILTYPPHNVDISKIHVMDINRQNIGESLNSKYGMKIDTAKAHSREPYFKHMVFAAFKKHLPLLSSFLSTELTIYSEIINKLYPLENYTEEKKLPSGVFNTDEYLVNDNIPQDFKHRINWTPLNQHLIYEQFKVKSVNVESELSKVMHLIKSDGKGSIETVLRENEDNDASSNSSQLLVDNLF